MKKTISVALVCSILFTACDSKKTDDKVKEEIQKNMDDVNTSVSTQGKEGRGKITLECNGSTYEVNGVCGAVSVMGSMTVAVKDDSVSVKVFTIGLPGNKLPEASTSYTIVKSVLDDNDPTHVSVGFTDMRSALPMIWESDNGSGKLDFVVNGDEIKCTFSNIVLKPNEMYNKEAQSKPGTVSGEFTIYKK